MITSIKFKTNMRMYVTRGTDYIPVKTMKEFYINIESIVYGIPIKNVDIFRMEQVFQQTCETPGIIQSLTGFMIRRLRACHEMRVGNFEHLLLR